MDIFFDKYLEKYYANYPIMYTDVGGSGGIPQRWMKLSRYLRKIIFEPDIKAYEQLTVTEDKEAVIINTALGRCKEKVDFYITKKQQTSSIYLPNMDFLKDFPEKERFNVEAIIKIETDTLDNQLKNNNVNDVDFIKIDTQGNELSILEGSIDTISKSLIGLEIEVEFSPLYVGQPLFADIDAFVRKYDFQLFDLESCYWKRSGTHWKTIRERQNTGISKGQIIFADALYFKTPDALFKILNGIEDIDLRKSKIFKCISILVLYGHFDYAIYICNRAKCEGIIDKFETDILITNLESEIVGK